MFTKGTPNEKYIEVKAYKYSLKIWMITHVLTEMVEKRQVSLLDVLKLYLFDFYTFVIPCKVDFKREKPIKEIAVPLRKTHVYLFIASPCPISTYVVGVGNKGETYFFSQNCGYSPFIPGRLNNDFNKMILKESLKISTREEAKELTKLYMKLVYQMSPEFFEFTLRKRTGYILLSSKEDIKSLKLSNKVAKRIEKLIYPIKSIKEGESYKVEFLGLGMDGCLWNLYKFRVKINQKGECFEEKDIVERYVEPIR
jgi:hypothetical protein